jgi:tRNA G10  N-methylase Trm11
LGESRTSQERLEEVVVDFLFFLKKKKNEKPQPDVDAPGYIHVPQRVAYPYRELLQDLCDLAADVLVPGGRLVFWHAADKGIV